MALFVTGDAMKMINYLIKFLLRGFNKNIYIIIFFKDHTINLIIFN